MLGYNILYYYFYFSMGSSLRMRSYHHSGVVPTGPIFQSRYEIAHMVLETTEVENGQVVWTDDLMHQFYDMCSPDVHFVERVSLYFSGQFCYRLSWPSTEGKN